MIVTCERACDSFDYNTIYIVAKKRRDKRGIAYQAICAVGSMFTASLSTFSAIWCCSRESSTAPRLCMLLMWEGLIARALS